MRAEALKVPSSLALVAVLALGACGGEAESAGDDDSRPLAAATAPPEPAVSAAPDEAADAPTNPAHAPVEPAEGEPREVDEPAPAGPVPEPTPEAAAPAGGAPSPAPRRTADAAPERAPAAEAPAPEPAPPTVAAGTQMGLFVRGELSTETHAPGDRFEAVVVEDVLAGDGMVLVPSGARVVGHVAESRESPGPDEPAVLTLAVDALVLNGRTVPVRATVLDLEVEAGRRDSDVRTAAKVGAGVAAGAVLGRILGKDTESTIKGAVAGAAAGGAVAVATRGAHAVVRDGARVLVRIDRPLVVDR